MSNRELTGADILDLQELLIKANEEHSADGHTCTVDCVVPDGPRWYDQFFKPNKYEAWVREELPRGRIFCECGEPDGCEEKAVDLFECESGTVYALCERCLKECV